MIHQNKFESGCRKEKVSFEKIVEAWVTNNCGYETNHERPYPEDAKIKHTISRKVLFETNTNLNYHLLKLDKSFVLPISEAKIYQDERGYYQLKFTKKAILQF
jgi:hypothetical protein